jgi:hypothetical protein
MGVAGGPFVVVSGKFCLIVCVITRSPPPSPQNTAYCASNPGKRCENVSKKCINGKREREKNKLLSSFDSDKMSLSQKVDTQPQRWCEKEELLTSKF